MATKFSDIIAARESNPDTRVPDEIIAIRDTTPGVTDQLYTNNVIDALGGVDRMPWWLAGDDGLKYSNSPTIPTLPMVLKALGLTDDDPKKKKGARTAARKFVEDWKHKRKEWEEIIKENKLLGEHGWKTVEDMWKRANIDLMNDDIKAAREQAMAEAPLDFGLFTLPNIPGSTTLTKIAFPRATERLASTGTVEPQDVALDLGNIGMMSIPGSGFVGLGGAIARRAAPSAVLSARKAADALRASNSALLSVLPGIGGAAVNTAGNTVVPLASEVLDDIVYDPGEGMDDRANFSVGDVILGGAINQGVNRGLVQMVGPLADKYSGQLASGAGAKKVREILSNIGRSRAQMGKDFANDVALKTSVPVVRISNPGTTLTPGEVDALKMGSSIIPEGVSVEDYIDAKKLQKVLGLIDDGTLTLSDYGAAAGKRSTAAKKALIEGAEGFEKDAKELAEKALEMDAPAAKRAFSNAAGLQSEAEIWRNLAENGKNVTELAPHDIIAGIKGLPDLPQGAAMSVDEVSDAFLKHPELINYMFWKNAPLSRKVENVVHQAWPSLVINEAGRSKFAREVADVVKEDIDSNREESKNQAKKVGVAKVLKAGNKDNSLTADDQKYLGIIADNPDVMISGLSDLAENDKFKLWLITRGNDLLRGTEAHRPLWKVE